MALRGKTEKVDPIETLEDGRQVDNRTGAVLDQGFGDENDPTLAERYLEDAAPAGFDGKTTSVLTDEEIGGIRTAQDLADLMAAKNLVIADSRIVLGGGVVIDKELLENKPFFIVDWKYAKSREFGQHFSVVTGVLMEGRVHDIDEGQLFLFTDGGFGIHGKLADYYIKEGQTTPIACRGLTKSTYPVRARDPQTGDLIPDPDDPTGYVTLKNPDGSVRMGATWHIA